MIKVAVEIRNNLRLKYCVFSLTLLQQEEHRPHCSPEKQSHFYTIMLIKTAQNILFL